MEKSKLKKELRAYLIKTFGKQCNEYGLGCVVCDIWAAFDAMFR